ncbi:MAG: hypothetical protein AB1Z23_01855 [Eubacteriales bacterium]
MDNFIIILFSVSAVLVLYLLGLFIKKQAWKKVYKSFKRISSERYNGYDKYVAQSMTTKSRLYRVSKLYIAFEDDKIVLLRNEGSNQKYACEFSKRNIKEISSSSYGLNVFIEIKHSIDGLVTPYTVEIFTNHIEAIEDAVNRMAASLGNMHYK